MAAVPPGQGKPPPGGPPKGKLGAWIKKNPGMAAALGGAGLLGAFVLIKKGSAANSAGTGAADTSTIGTVDPSLYGTPSDLGGAGSFGSTDATTIEDQLSALSGQLTQISQAGAPAQAGGGPGTPAGGVTGGGGKGSGGSYSPNQPHKLTGPQYQWLKSHNKGAYGAAGGRYTGARGWAWLRAHPVKK